MIGLCDAQLSASDFPHGYDFDPEQVGFQKTFCDTYLILSNDTNKVGGRRFVWKLLSSQFSPRPRSSNRTSSSDSSKFWPLLNPNRL